MQPHKSSLFSISQAFIHAVKAFVYIIRRLSIRQGVCLHHQGVYPCIKAFVHVVKGLSMPSRRLLHHQGVYPCHQGVVLPSRRCPCHQGFVYTVKTLSLIQICLSKFPFFKHKYFNSSQITSFSNKYTQKLFYCQAFSNPVTALLFLDFN
jgi:hypothetical protein